jgi:hypothetical protein
MTEEPKRHQLTAVAHNEDIFWEAPMILQDAMVHTQRQEGFVLATVLVFLLVLTLGVFFSAGMTRTNVQVVNNEQNQKEAFAAAEAGVDEALYRMSLVGGDTAAITGINGGTAFDASLTPTVPGRDTTNGASNYGITNTDTASTSQILFVTTAPVSGQNGRVPSLQPPATNRNLYSTSTADGAPVDMTATANLTIGWDLCTAPQAAIGASVGCGGGTGSIRQYPPGAATTRPIVKIVSTGQSGSARQRITVRATDCIPSSGITNGGIVSLGGICTQGVGLNGAGTISAAGVIQINAGATSNNPSTCTAASTGGAGSSISGSEINVVGGVSGNFNPPANTGVLPTADPYAGANLLPPCFTNGALQCQGDPSTQSQPGLKNGAACGGTASSPAVCTASSSGDVLSPGIYYGGVRISAGTAGNPIRLQPGVYIMAGGGFSSTSGNNYVVSNSGGVFIYNTSDPSHPTGTGAAASFNLANGNTLANLVAPSSGTFAGVVLYQDRTLSPQPDISITGGNALHILDGLVYAPGANFNVQGGTPASTTIGGSLIVNSISMIGASSLIVQNPATPVPTAACQTFAYVPIGWQDF